MHFSQFLSSALLLATSAVAGAPKAADIFKRAVETREAAAERRGERHSPAVPQLASRGHGSGSRFLNNKTQQFVVDGTAIPGVPFDIGESYAGLLPISDSPDETRKLFFWFFPTTNKDACEEVTLWFNGGPGCSSLSGLLTENGPFTWEDGTLAPTQNPYTWVNLTNMLWVEQPVGVGYTQGVPNITNEVDLSLELIGFYKSFIDAFGLKGWDTYLTGESYAGYYVPYIADAFISHADDSYYKLKGIAINDPIIGDGTAQQQVVIAPYVDYWSKLFYLNESFTQALHHRADQCGYTDYLAKYLTYPPPPGPFPVLPDPYASANLSCDIFDDVYNAVLEVNPCFNIYHITDTCPHLYDVLGIVNPGDYSPPGATVYFNRTDVQKAINAPVGTNWMQCTNINVFGDASNRTTNQTNQDRSLGPAQDGVLQRVIEYTNNTIIGSGNLDMLLNTNGTLLAIQNMTWNGAQGFQKYPGTDFYVPYHPEYNGGALSGAGNVGSWGAERGLTFYSVQLSGHELPGYAPGAGYRALELLLGRIDSLSDTCDFTTQSGNYTGTSPILKHDTH